MKYGEIGARPLGYLVLACIGGIGSALVIAGLATLVIVASIGEFTSTLPEQVLISLLVWPLVMVTQYLVALTFCAAILHSRSQRATAGEALGTGYRTAHIVVVLPFETTDWSRFWVAMHHSGWRAYLAMYPAVVAVAVIAADQNVALGLPLIAISVAGGFWQWSAAKKKAAAAAIASLDEKAAQQRYEQGVAARERRAARGLEAAATREIIDAWIDAELTTAMGVRLLHELKRGDHRRLDVVVSRAQSALAGRVPEQQLRARALELAGAAR